MQFDEYQELARRTQNTALPLWALRQHAIFGMTSEVGEIAGMHQKIHQGHPLDDTALRLEIGDVLWFLAEICDVYGFSLEDVAIANIQKLRMRYKDKFTVEESVHRKEYEQKPKKEPVKSRWYTAVKDVSINGNA